MQVADETPHRTVVLDPSTKLAFARTRAAYERTMMSWIRTATSLIVFGFSVYKFFQIEAPRREQQHHLIGARGFAFMLVGIGLVSLVLATVEHRHRIRMLGAQDGDSRRSLAVLVAALISVLGILGLLAMIFRQ
ncbi:MAG: YidH family protein [Candidatus Binataceae bacterium]